MLRIWSLYVCFTASVICSSCQDPLFWDQRCDWCGGGAGGHHAAGPGHEEDGAEHVWRPQRGSQRQPCHQPRGTRGPCEEEVRLLMAPPTCCNSFFFFFLSFFFFKFLKVTLQVKLVANLRFQNRAVRSLPRGVPSVTAAWCYLFSCATMSEEDFPWLCFLRRLSDLSIYINMYAQMGH